MAGKQRIPDNLDAFNIGGISNEIFCPTCNEWHPLKLWRDTSRYCPECNDDHEGLYCKICETKYIHTEDNLKGRYVERKNTNMIFIETKYKPEFDACTSFDELLSKINDFVREGKAEIVTMGKTNIGLKRMQELLEDPNYFDIRLDF